MLLPTFGPVATRSGPAPFQAWGPNVSMPYLMPVTGNALTQLRRGDVALRPTGPLLGGQLLY